MILEQQIKVMQDEIQEILPLVREIHTIVIGSENNRNDSMLNKMQRMEIEIQKLKDEKIIRYAQNKIWSVVNGFIIAIVSSVTASAIVFYLTKK